MAHPALKDMTNTKVGRWTVLARAGNAKRGGALWLCRCECGTLKEITGGTLRSGASTGCVSCADRSHIVKHGGVGTRLYKIWSNIKSRCLNENNPRFKDYGGRGIYIHKGWLEFGAFQDWAQSSGYDDHLTIERTDNDGPYSPSNCIWADYKAQARNRRGASYQNDEGVPLVHIAKSNGVSRDMFYGRIRRGMEPLEAATKPKA